MHKPRFDSGKYDSPFGDKEYEEDFEKWENAVIEEGEAKELEERSEEEQC